MYGPQGRVWVEQPCSYRLGVDTSKKGPFVPQLASREALFISSLLVYACFHASSGRLAGRGHPLHTVRCSSTTLRFRRATTGKHKLLGFCFVMSTFWIHHHFHTWWCWKGLQSLKPSPNKMRISFKKKISSGKLARAPSALAQQHLEWIWVEWLSNEAPGPAACQKCKPSALRRDGV